MLPVLLQGVIWPPLLGGRCAKPFLDLLLNHLCQLSCRTRLLARATWLGLGCCCLAKGLLACTPGCSEASLHL